MKTYLDQMAYAHKEELMAKNTTSIRNYPDIKQATYEYKKSLRSGEFLYLELY